VIEGYRNFRAEYAEDISEDPADRPYLELAPDEFHKSNFSCGAPYGMSIPDERADGEFLNEWNETTFVNYLRIALHSGGFPKRS
jgi:hypothetical protein